MQAIVVGAGRMGNRHARVARSLGLETFTVDPDREADFRSIEEAPAAEVVAVATPIAELATSARSAMLAGCERLLIEKPMAATVAEAESLLSSAEAARTHVLVGYSDRFDPLVGLLKRELPALVGEVRRLSFTRRSPSPRWPSPGPSIDLAVHDIDLLRFLGFSPSVTSSSAANGGVVAELASNGTIASIDARYDANVRERRILVEGSLCALDCDLVSRTLVYRDPRWSVQIAPEMDGTDAPLVAEWQALLSGAGPGGDDGLAALSLAWELADRIGQR